MPELSLNEIDTSVSFGNSSVVFKVPVLVISKKVEEAKKLSLVQKDIPVGVVDGGTIDVYVNGSSKPLSVGKHHLERVGDGIEVAKAIRGDDDCIPFIETSQIKDMDLYIKQLRIAMFLTESKDMRALKRAPIYEYG